MVFSSYHFIFSFLPLVFVIFWALNFFKLLKTSQIFLIVASLYFYYKGVSTFVYFFMGQIILNYWIGSGLLTPRFKRPLRLSLLYIGLMLNLGVLFSYKYTNFFIELWNQALEANIPTAKILLPLGLSFFTFRILSYVVDCYHWKAEKYSFMEFALFVAYFPALIIGPIVRHQEFIPQLRNKMTYKFNGDNFLKAVFRFSIGLAKKVLIATPLLTFISTNVHVEHATPLVLFIGLFANLSALYFDFSGYTDMAIGISLLFNIELKENFNSPYKARNIHEYWQKWHITLTKFLTDYVFKYFYKPGAGIFKFCTATIITFLLSGFWHGAGTTYILWGGIHGMALCFLAVIATRIERKYFLPKFLARSITVLFLLFTAQLYSCGSVGQFLQFITGLWDVSFFRRLGYDSSNRQILLFFYENLHALVVLVVSLLISFYAKNTAELTQKCTTNFKYAVFSGVLIVLALFSLGSTSDFIYFKF